MSDRLGIIDWGIGGIGVYKLIKERTTVPLTYFSDTGVTPYGKMASKELTSRLDRLIGFLKNRGVTHLVLGCNAASTAIPFLEDHGIPVLGVIETAVEQTVRTRPTSLGLIGGRRTVVSGVYRKAFAERGINVQQRVAQPLSGMIESGDLTSTDLRAQCKTILGPLKNCSHILLACTHYPAIEPVLKEFVSSRTRFIDPSPTLVRRVQKCDLNRENQIGASFIMSNNILVTVRAFATGALFGVGAFYDLAFEGARLGSVFGACYKLNPPFGNALATFVVGHGVIELSCIFFCGGAGMMIGYAMIAPGDLTRAQALKKKGMEAARLVIGCACFLVVAGTIEGFLSPSELPATVKIGTGIGTGIALYSYLFLAGRVTETSPAQQ